MISTAWSWLRANKYLVGGVAAALVLAYAAGRYAAPTKTVEVTVEKEVIKEVEKKVTVQGPIKWKTTIKTVPGPQGPERIVVREVEKEPRVEYVDRSILTDREKIVEKIVERDAPRLLLMGHGGVNVNTLTPAYGGGLSYRVGGPVYLGADYTRIGAENVVQLGLGVGF